MYLRTVYLVYFFFQHTLIHSGEMPFSCHLCPKRFNRSYTLKNHMKLHSAGSLPAKFQVAGVPATRPSPRTTPAPPSCWCRCCRRPCCRCPCCRPAPWPSPSTRRHSFHSGQGCLTVVLLISATDTNLDMNLSNRSNTSLAHRRLPGHNLLRSTSFGSYKPPFKAAPAP